MKRTNKVIIVLSDIYVKEPNGKIRFTNRISESIPKEQEDECLKFLDDMVFDITNKYHVSVEIRAQSPAEEKVNENI